MSSVMVTNYNYWSLQGLTSSSQKLFPCPQDSHWEGTPMTASQLSFTQWREEAILKNFLRSNSSKIWTAGRFWSSCTTRAYNSIFAGWHGWWVLSTYISAGGKGACDQTLTVVVPWRWILANCWHWLLFFSFEFYWNHMSAWLKCPKS